MPRNSASPPRRRSRYDDRNSSGRDYRSRRDDRDRDREYRDSRPRRDDNDRGYSRRPPRDSQEQFGYDEREREKERRRDRDRYDTHAESSRKERRSASPSRRSRSRSASADEEKDKSKPNFKPSGLLAAETNTVKASDGTATVLKYNEPPEARKPVVGWRLYVFKGQEQLGTSLRNSFLCSSPHHLQGRSISISKAHISLAGIGLWQISFWTTLLAQNSTQLFSVRVSYFVRKTVLNVRTCRPVRS